MKLVSSSAVLLLSIITLAGGGCTGQHTPAVWVGAEFDRLRSAFGEPAGILINERSNRTYAFRYSADPSADAIASNDMTPLAYGDATLPLNDADCVILFELAGPAVVSWDWQGQGCGKRAIPLPYQHP